MKFKPLCPWIRLIAVVYTPLFLFCVTFWQQNTFRKSSQGLDLRKVFDNDKWKIVYIHTTNQQRQIRTHQDYGSFGSQEGQDKVILNIFGSKSGYFVDLAANDGRVISNTFELELQADWSGLCIEPNIQYIQSHLTRKCSFISSVISDVDGDTVNFLMNDGFGGIVDTDTDNQNVDKRKQKLVSNFTTVSIKSIFQDFNVPKTIDYFSLDVEGAEERIIGSFPFNSHTVYVFTIERPNQRVRKILLEHDYVEVGVLGTFGDIMYILRTMPGFEDSMKSAQILMIEICSIRLSKHARKFQLGKGLEGSLSAFPVFSRSEKKWIAAGPRCMNNPMICTLELPAWNEDYHKFIK